MKIAMLGHKRIPSREGGVEVVVEELSTRMVKLGNEVICYNRDGHHVSGKNFDIQKSDYYNGVQLSTVFTIDYKGLAAVTSSFFAAVKASLSDCEIVHFHAEGPSVMCFLPKLFGKKVIVTVHGLDHQRAKWGKWGRKYILLGEKNAVRFADQIIVLSKSTQEYFLEKYNKKTNYIPNGISKCQVVKPSKITQKGIKENKYVLYLGRLVPEKGIHYLIKAFIMMDTEYQLVIAGGSSDSTDYVSYLHELAQGKDNILFTGFVQGEFLKELYSNAWVYVLPSDLEGMPLSLLEAMSYGNCCLVSNIPECTEVVEDNAVTFEKGNIDSLYNQLLRLLNDSDLVKKYRDNAQNFILSKYNWDNVTKNTLSLYTK